MLGRAVAAISPRPDERPSIAVLPFANMAGEQEQDFFSDGIADDLITDLTKVSGLFVASRHTAFALKGVQLDIWEAGPRLGVRYVLLGSVRKAGDRIRLTTQLIDTDTGEYLWAERYDRVLTDVFAVQDEITHNIVDVLKVKLLPGEEDALRKSPTGDIDAYQLYLRGQQLFGNATRHAYEVARRVFAQAVALDQEFARAHAGIAECEACLPSTTEDPLAIGETLATAQSSAPKLEPSLAAAHVARGLACRPRGDSTRPSGPMSARSRWSPNTSRPTMPMPASVSSAGARRRRPGVPPGRGAAPQRHLRLLILMGIEKGWGRLERSVATARLIAREGRAGAGAPAGKWPRSLRGGGGAGGPG